MKTISILQRAMFFWALLLAFGTPAASQAADYPLANLTLNIQLLNEFMAPFSVPCESNFNNHGLSNNKGCVQQNLESIQTNFESVRSFMKDSQSNVTVLKEEITKLTETVEQNRLDLIMHVNAATVEKIRDQVRKELQSEMDAKIKAAVEKALNSRK